MNRLDKLFEKFNSEGLYAVQDCACCSSCSLALIEDAIGDKPGFVFYHNQDLEGLNSSGTLYLGYGEALDGEEEWVGDKVASIAKEMGIEVEWNGSVHERIMLKLPELEGEIEMPCDYCDDSGYVECWQCGGSGYIEDCEDEEAEDELCHDCDGNGEEECAECNV